MAVRDEKRLRTEERRRARNAKASAVKLSKRRAREASLLREELIAFPTFE
jgi:hypothetical protein